jgi:predicted TIM-barrel fold metal-dependent hydrolase
VVIDFHAHIYPERIAPRAAVSAGGFYGVSAEKDGTAGTLLDAGRRGGIDRFVVFSVTAVPGQVGNINNYIASACAEHPEFIGFGTLHQDMEDPGAEIDRIAALGLKGVKFHPDMQRCDIDDEAMMRLYGLLEGRLPVIIHCGDYRYSYSHPRRLVKVIDRFPGLTIVAAHFGGWSLFEIALDLLRDRFCYLDISSSIPFMGARRAGELIGIYGAERILFGSDYPMWDPAACLEQFLELKLSGEDRELILYKNALRILDRGDAYAS